MTAVWRRAALLAPSLGWIAAFLVLPLCLMAYVSTLARGPTMAQTLR